MNYLPRAEPSLKIICREHHRKKIPFLFLSDHKQIKTWKFFLKHIHIKHTYGLWAYEPPPTNWPSFKKNYLAEHSAFGQNQKPSK
jgi:hypothetical protein